MEEESELEEIVESDEVEEVADDIEDSDEELADVDDDMIENRFTQPIEMRGGSLESVAGSQENIWTRDANARAADEDESQVSYGVNAQKDDDSKYDEPNRDFQGASIGIGPDVNFAREERASRPQDFVFNSPESRENSSQNFNEDYAQPKRFELEDKKLPFEEDVKYK